MECLITKLKSSINDDSLLKINELGITSTKAPEWDRYTQKFTISYKNPTDIYIVGDGYFTDSNGTQNYGKTINGAGDIYISNGNFQVRFPNKSELTTFYMYSEKPKYATKDFMNGIKGLDYCAYLTRASIYDVDVKAVDKYEVKGLGKYFKTFQTVNGLHILYQDTNEYSHLIIFNKKSSNINIDNPDEVIEINGMSNLDIALINDFTRLKKFTPGNGLANGYYSLYGSVENLSPNENLIEFDIRSQVNVAGNIKIFSKFTSLQKLIVQATGVKGDISELIALTNLSYFDGGNTAFTGDFFSILASKSFEYFYINGTFTYTTKSFSGKQYKTIGGTNCTCINLDNFLQDFTQASSMGSGSKIQMIGTRTSASDSAISTLQSKGFTVSVPAATQSISTLMMRASAKSSCKIAYIDDELIIGVTELEIYPAEGVTVKEFNSEDEANEFIIENNIVTK